MSSYCIARVENVVQALFQSHPRNVPLGQSLEDAPLRQIDDRLTGENKCWRWLCGGLDR